MKHLLMFFVIVAAFSGHCFAADWLGTFTTDVYPANNYVVEAVGSKISNGTYYKAAQRQDFNDGNNFLQQTTNSILEIEGGLVEQAQKQGFNAILGYKVYTLPMYNGFGSSTINGLEGVGYGIVLAQGVPVKLKKDNSFFK